MLYKFKSQVAAEVLMTKSTAEELLTIIGKPAEPQGIVTAAQAPAAIAALRAAIEQREAAQKEAAKAQAEKEAKDEDEQEARDSEQFDSGVYNRGISLRQRAAPFIDLLERTSAAGKDVVWGV
ncbi:MAG: DUF1840 family protein [Ottowia sp.]|nr:DUF1840 family protein [Ottowia sp.]